MDWIEASIARRIALKFLTYGIAWSAHYLVGAPLLHKLGVTVDPTQFQAGVYLLLDILRHDVVKKYPTWAPLLS